MRRLQELRRIIQEECDSLLLRKERLREEVGLLATWPPLPQDPLSMGPSGQHPHQHHHSFSLSKHSERKQQQHAWQVGHSDVWAPGRHAWQDQSASANRDEEAPYRHGGDRPAASSLWRHGTEQQQQVAVVAGGGGGRCDAWTQVPVSELELGAGSSTSEALSDVARAYEVEAFGLMFPVACMLKV